MTRSRPKISGTSTTRVARWHIIFAIREQTGGALGWVCQPESRVREHQSGPIITIPSGSQTARIANASADAGCAAWRDRGTGRRVSRSDFQSASLTHWKTRRRGRDQNSSPKQRRVALKSQIASGATRRGHCCTGPLPAKSGVAAMCYDTREPPGRLDCRLGLPCSSRSFPALRRSGRARQSMNLACILFCPSAPARRPRQAGLHRGTDKEPYARPIIQRWEGTGPRETVPPPSPVAALCYGPILEHNRGTGMCLTIGHGQTRLFHPDGSVNRAVRRAPDHCRGSRPAIRHRAVSDNSVIALPGPASRASSMAPQTDRRHDFADVEHRTGAICRSTAPCAASPRATSRGVPGGLPCGIRAGRKGRFSGG